MLAGCGRAEAPRGGPPPAEQSPRPQGLAVRALADTGRTLSLAVRVLADTGRTLSLAAPPPDVSVTLARVSPARLGVSDPPLPSAAPDTLLPVPEPRASRHPAHLLPPILRQPGVLIAPAGLVGATAVELDVRVDALGRVVDVRWAAGNSDTALVGAAQRCAAGMQFYPALLGGKPVEVWCRQRFELAPK